VAIAKGKDGLTEIVDVYDITSVNPSLDWSTDQLDFINYFYKIREKILSFPNITTSALLREKALAELEQSIRLLDRWDIELVENEENTGRYRVGDIISIRYQDQDGLLDVDTTARVYGIDISYDDRGVENVKLDLSFSADRRSLIKSRDPQQRLINKVLDSSDRLTELEK
jgi:hypothetical protein